MDKPFHSPLTALSPLSLSLSLPLSPSLARSEQVRKNKCSPRIAVFGKVAGVLLDAAAGYNSGLCDFVLALLRACFSRDKAALKAGVRQARTGSAGKDDAATTAAATTAVGGGGGGGGGGVSAALAPSPLSASRPTMKLHRQGSVEGSIGVGAESALLLADIKKAMDPKVRRHQALYQHYNTLTEEAMDRRRGSPSATTTPRTRAVRRRTARTRSSRSPRPRYLFYYYY